MTFQPNRQFTRVLILLVLLHSFISIIWNTEHHHHDIIETSHSHVINLEFGNPDFVKYAESYGASGHRVMSAQDLIPTYEKAFSAGGVHLVELPVDYSENQKVLIDELAEKVCLI